MTQVEQKENISDAMCRAVVDLAELAGNLPKQEQRENATALLKALLAATRYVAVLENDSLIRGQIRAHSATFYAAEGTA